MRYGYACISMQLSYPQKWGNQPKGIKPITTGRSMIRRTFDSKGHDYASELTLANCKDLDSIMDWNVGQGYDFYRITSGLAPWKSEYEWTDLKDLDDIKYHLESAGLKASVHDIRITSHPGPFNVLTSPHEHVVKNCVRDLSEHGDVFDFMGELLPESVQTRLTVENDDKASMYSVKELYEGIYKRIGVPVVFDYHHHRFCSGGLTEQEALELAMSTWPKGIVPVVHYSESRSIEQEDDKIKPQAHSDYVLDYIDTYGNDVDIMIEAKHKELAVNKYRRLWT